MLGIKMNMSPASAEASIEIRNSALRKATGNLNDDDLKAIQHQKTVSTKYYAEWK